MQVSKMTLGKKAIVNNEEPSFTQSSMFSPKIFETVGIEHWFPPLIESNIFGILDYDGHKRANIGHPLNHLLTSINLLEVKLLNPICELERRQMLTLLARCFQISQLAGYLLTEKPSNYL